MEHESSCRVCVSAQLLTTSSFSMARATFNISNISREIKLFKYYVGFPGDRILEGGNF